VILFVVLWQYIKVLFSKHILELHDVGGQRIGNGLHLLTASGSFHKMLGGCSHSLKVDLDKLWEDMYKEQSVSKLPIWVVCLQRHFFKL